MTIQKIIGKAIMFCMLFCMSFWMVRTAEGQVTATARPLKGVGLLEKTRSIPERFFYMEDENNYYAGMGVSHEFTWQGASSATYILTVSLGDDTTVIDYGIVGSGTATTDARDVASNFTIFTIANHDKVPGTVLYSDQIDRLKPGTCFITTHCIFKDSVTGEEFESLVASEVTLGSMPRPNLRMTNLTFRGTAVSQLDYPQENQIVFDAEKAITMQAMVTNLGGGATASSFTVLFTGDVSIDTVRVPILGSGGDYEINRTVSQLKEGYAYSLTAFADSGKAIAEYNENDNTISRTFHAVQSVILYQKTSADVYSIVKSAQTMKNLSLAGTNHLEVRANGTASQAVCSGTVHVKKNGVADTVSIQRDGVMTLDAGAVLKGMTTVEGHLAVNGVVTGADGATVCWTLRQPDCRNVSDSVRRNVIENAGNLRNVGYRLDVTSETKGRYVLATGAASFRETISVMEYGQQVGSFVWNEGTGRYEDVERADGSRLSLVKDSAGRLVLTVQLPDRILEKLAVSFGKDAKGTAWTDGTVVTLDELYRFKVVTVFANETVGFTAFGLVQVDSADANQRLGQSVLTVVGPESPADYWRSSELSTRTASAAFSAACQWLSQQVAAQQAAYAVGCGLGGTLAECAALTGAPVLEKVLTVNACGLPQEWLDKPSQAACVHHYVHSGDMGVLTGKGYLEGTHETKEYLDERVLDYAGLGLFDYMTAIYCQTPFCTLSGVSETCRDVYGTADDFSEPSFGYVHSGRMDRSYVMALLWLSKAAVSQTGGSSPMFGGKDLSLANQLTSRSSMETWLKRGGSGVIFGLLEFSKDETETAFAGTLCGWGTELSLTPRGFKTSNGIYLSLEEDEEHRYVSRCEELADDEIHGIVIANSTKDIPILLFNVNRQTFYPVVEKELSGFSLEDCERKESHLIYSEHVALDSSESWTALRLPLRGTYPSYLTVNAVMNGATGQPLEGVMLNGEDADYMVVENAAVGASGSLDVSIIYEVVESTMMTGEWSLDETDVSAEQKTLHMSLMDSDASRTAGGSNDTVTVEARTVGSSNRISFILNETDIPGLFSGVMEDFSAMRLHAGDVIELQYHDLLDETGKETVVTATCAAVIQTLPLHITCEGMETVFNPDATDAEWTDYVISLDIDCKSGKYRLGLADDGYSRSSLIAVGTDHGQENIELKPGIETTAGDITVLLKNQSGKLLLYVVNQSVDPGLNDYRITVRNGWNLIGFPCDSAEQKEGEAPCLADGALFACGSGDAFVRLRKLPAHSAAAWYYSDRTAVITVKTTLAVSSELTLHEGWNFVGLPSGEDLMAMEDTEVLSALTCWEWNGTDWMSIPLENVKAGKGYYVYAERDVVLPIGEIVLGRFMEMTEKQSAEDTAALRVSAASCQTALTIHH